MIQSQKPRSASVEMVNGRPMIVINGETHYPMIHSLTDVPSGRWSWEELPQHNIRNFAKAGVHLFQLDLFLEHVWPGENAWDLTLARKQVAGVLEVCPDAGIFFRFHLRAPTWWLRKHPEEWVVYADSDYIDEQQYGLLRIIEHDNNPVRRVSMASRKWRDAVSEKFIQFLGEFSATPEGNALAGIQVANGVYGEWHNWGFFDNEPDVSPPMTRAFREWTRLKYGSEDSLRKAWNNPDIRFDSITAPGMDKRACEGIFRDPATEREVIDFYTCMHETVADNIIHFTRLLKATWPRPIIAGTFYGYYFSTFGRQAAGGHLQLQKILRADSIDYLSGPQAYEPEAYNLGDPYRSRSLITSIRLHEKLWLDEMDVEPKIPILKDADYERRVQESVADVRRNAAFTYTKGMGFWFYDFNISGVDLDGYLHLMSGSQGNWDHPVVMRQIETMRKLFHERAVSQPYTSEADVLFVYDTDSLYYTASLRGDDPVSTALIDYNTLAAFRSGVVFDPVHLDDLDKVDLEQYRVVVFGNTFVLSEQERAFIRDSVATGGRSLVWFHAPGFIDEDSGTAGIRHVAALTGFSPEELPTANDPAAAMEAGTDPEVLHRDFGDHQAWFLNLPSRKPEPLRSILSQAGAHVYSAGEAFFYAGGGILVLHSLKGGPQEITLKNRQKITLNLPEGPVTVLMDARTGEVLLGGYSTETASVVVQYPPSNGR